MAKASVIEGAVSASSSLRRSDLRIGTSGWHYASWHGPFYPFEVKAKGELAFYATRFDATEINNSFYRVPTEKAVAAWRDGTPDDFVFAWKMSRFVTHYKRIADVAENLAFIFGRMAPLGEKGGPVLFQLPPQLHADRERLARLLMQLPTDGRYVFEFRHASWYERPILDLLAEHDVALCLSDHAVAPAPWEVTARFVYVRGHGPSGRYHGSYTDAVLQGWAADIRHWRGAGKSVYCFFDNDVKSAAPHDAERLRRFAAGPEPERARGRFAPGELRE